MWTTEDHTVAAGHRVTPASWQTRLDELLGRIAGRFGRVEPRRHARALVLGLLSGLPRKNCWTIAEHAGQATPDSLQHLLSRAVWDEHAVRDDIRDYLLEHLADPAAVLVVDETGDLKKGTTPSGCNASTPGTAGKVDNAQVAVYLAYATTAGHGVIDRELYLPQGWLADPARCRAAGVPTQVEFQTKPELARRRLERALDAGVPAGWVTADEVYGGSAALRGWLETRQLPYVLAVRCTEPLSPASGPPHPTLAARLAERIPPAGWLLGDPGHAGVRVPGGGCGHPARPASRAPGAIQLTCNEITTCSPRWSWWRRRQQARARARACHYRRQAAQQP